MNQSDKLPEPFLRELEELENFYLSHNDPIRQSGFGGGAKRWRAEREPILDAVTSDGDILDIGCANGYLLECLVEWGLERGIRLIPFGLDQGARLIELARARLPQSAENFFIGNAWDWEPQRRFQFVYSLYDCVPLELLGEYINRLLVRVVSPGGRLIIGAYGSVSRATGPFDIAAFLHSTGFSMVGRSQGGTPPITQFAWIDN